MALRACNTAPILRECTRARAAFKVREQRVAWKRHAGQPTSSDSRDTRRNVVEKDVSYPNLRLHSIEGHKDAIQIIDLGFQLFKTITAKAVEHKVVVLRYGQLSLEVVLQ
jgi:hypothetical protein